MRKYIAAALAISAIACSPSGQAGSGARPSYPKSQLKLEDRRIAEPSSLWLVGYWDHDQECRSGAGTSLWPDGSYTMNDASGRWSLAGNLLTVSEKKAASVRIFQARIGDPGRSRIEVVGPTTLSVHWDGGGEARFYLCEPR
ncbi:MAG TPA: hypothetical protein VF911_13195 [Thermoanaerobaculia bacterium]|jgi:hypothetical protein